MSDNKVLYEIIGSGYNETRRADPYLTGKLFEFLWPKNDGIYIDIGCGTGNYTIALADKGLNFYGIEPSEKMLNNAISRNDTVKWVFGEAERIPLPADFFDGAIATLTIHHWPDLKKAFKEIYRVLKPGGTLVIFTADPEQMKCYWLNYYFPEMMAASIIQMPTFYTLKRAAANAGITITGIEKYFISDDLKDIFLYFGKNKPGIYLNEQVRNGISSFAALAHKHEVEQGLVELSRAIQSQAFQAITDKFHNTQGDYLFIIAKKS